MITAIKELGELVLRESGKSTLGALLETVKAENYPVTVCIVLDENTLDITSLKIEETNAKGAEKYLYKRGSSRGSNYSPTCLVMSKKDDRVEKLESTYTNKLLGWFKTVARLKSLDDETRQHFLEIYTKLKDRKEELLVEILERTGDTNGRFVLTIKVAQHYLIDLQHFVDAFQEMIFSKQAEISAKDKVCSVCGQTKKVVYAGASPFKFYTIDKPGFISGGFIESQSWRNFPMCRECSLALEEGKKVLEKELAFNFYGLRYMLIPKFIFGSSVGARVVNSILREEMVKQIRLNERVGNSLTTYEDDVLAILAEEEDYLSLNLLFIQKQNAAERILLAIEDVFPSRLRRLFEAKETVDVIYPKMPFHLGHIRTFFEKSDPKKSKNDLDKLFLEVIDSVFKGRRLKFSLLIQHYMREIRRRFNNSNDESNSDFFYAVCDAIQSTMFFTLLGLLDSEEDDLMESRFTPVFTKYISQLDTNAKRAIFLLGGLTKMLLNVQAKERNSQPFLVNLKGLKLNEKDIKGLFPKVENKLREYSRFDKGKGKLAEEIARLFMAAKEGWNLTVDEISFYFVCGMNLRGEITDVLYNEKEETQDDNQ